MEGYKRSFPGSPNPWMCVQLVQGRIYQGPGAWSSGKNQYNLNKMFILFILRSLILLKYARVTMKT